MRTTILILLLATALSMAFPTSAAETEPMGGVQRFAMIIGTNDGGTDRVLLRYAESDATTIARVLREVGGVVDEDRRVLLSPGPGELEQAFLDLATDVKAAEAGGRSTQFFFYYSGHSDEQGLLLEGRLVEYAKLRELIKAVPADVRVGILDSCSSGAMTRTKGGTRRDPFLVDEGAVSGHAFLTSSSDSEVAQESDAIGGSFFTHYLVTGLRGAADVDRDRRVTLNEAYRFAFDETLERTQSTQGGAEHPAYDIQLVGTGDLVMTDLRETTSRLEIAESVVGRVFVRDAAGDLAAELFKPAGSPPVVLALEPGSYQIVVDDDGELWQVQLTLAEGTGALLSRTEMLAMAHEPATARGDAPTPPPAPPVEIAAGDAVDVQVEDPGYRTIGFTTGLFPPLTVNSVVKDRKVLNHFALNFIWGHAGAIDGYEMSIGGNSIDDDVRGVQFATLVNTVGGSVEGVQGGVVGNIVQGGFKGVQMGAVANAVGGGMNGVQAGAAVNAVQGGFEGFQGVAGANVVNGPYHGVQGAGAVNVVTGNFKGLQQAGGASIVGGDAHGLQLSVVNVAGNVKGMQLGVINIARDVDGVQVGVISVARDADASISVLGGTKQHGVGLAVWTSDVQALNVGTRFRARHTYTMLNLGIHPFGLGGSWSYGVGLGFHSQLGPIMDLEFDFTTSSVHALDRWDPKPALLETQRLMLGFRVRPIRIWAGLTFNEMLEWDCDGPTRPGYPYVVYEHTWDRAALRLWPGFAVGIEINPAKGASGDRG